MGTEEGPTPLNDLLNDEPNEAPAAPEPQETHDAASQPRDESGRFAKKGEEESASPAPVEENAFDGAATVGERKRRQAAEQERDAFRAELDALKQQFQQLQQPQTPPAPPPSVWEDEQAWGQHLVGRATNEASFNAALNTSEMLCRDKFDDFDQMKAKFLEMAQANPAVAQQALADAHPWRKAYQIASNAAKMEELGAVNVSDLEAKMREKIMAELQQGQTPVPQAPVLPPTLTGERNVGNRTGPAWGGPKSLTDLLS